MTFEVFSCFLFPLVFANLNLGNLDFIHPLIDFLMILILCLKLLA